MNYDLCSEKNTVAVSQIIADSNHVIALIGVGISAESGIPTFRGPGE